MVRAMLLAHLLGDYVFQPDFLARWKSRSVWGVLVHGVVVTCSLWLWSLPFAPNWWPYALGIGVVHTVIDILRVRIGARGPIVDLFLFLADQTVHISAIVVALAWSGWLGPRPAETAFGAWLQAGHHLTFAIGYVLLTMPTWVLVHFFVRAIGGNSTSLPGRSGEKYMGMLERSFIATSILVGQFILIPLVVAPRLVMDGRSGRMEAERFGYLNELFISVGLAVAVGLFLKGLA